MTFPLLQVVLWERKEMSVIPHLAHVLHICDVSRPRGQRPESGGFRCRHAVIVTFASTCLVTPEMMAASIASFLSHRSSQVKLTNVPARRVRGTRRTQGQPSRRAAMSSISSRKRRRAPALGSIRGSA